MNSDSWSELKQSTDFLSKAEGEREVNGETEVYNYYLKHFKEAQERAMDLQDKMDKFIDDVKNSNFIMEDWYESFKEYLLTLSIDQTFALLHIIFFVTMLLLVYNIIIIFYSDLIIKYFSLESKYPSFARFIELRRKFQTYYMSLNIIVLLLIIFLLLILNLLVFLNII